MRMFWKENDEVICESLKPRGLETVLNLAVSLNRGNSSTRPPGLRRRSFHLSTFTICFFVLPLVLRVLRDVFTGLYGILLIRQVVKAHNHIAEQYAAKASLPGFTGPCGLQPIGRLVERKAEEKGKQIPICGFVLLIMIEAVVENYIRELQMPLGFGRIHVLVAVIWTRSLSSPSLLLFIFSFSFDFYSARP